METKKSLLDRVLEDHLIYRTVLGLIGLTCLVPFFSGEGGVYLMMAGALIGAAIWGRDWFGD